MVVVTIVIDIIVTIIIAFSTSARACSTVGASGFSEMTLSACSQLGRGASQGPSVHSSGQNRQWVYCTLPPRNLTDLTRVVSMLNLRAVQENNPGVS